MVKIKVDYMQRRCSETYYDFTYLVEKYLQDLKDCNKTIISTQFGFDDSGEIRSAAIIHEGNE